MSPPSLRRTLLYWLLASLLGAALLGYRALREQQDRFLQDSSIAHRLLSQKTVQHDAVLATLAQLESPPAPERLLSGLQPAMPQLRAIGRWQGGRWLGPTPPPAGIADGIKLAAQQRRALPQAAGAGRYWLLDASGWALLIDARHLLADSDWPPALARISLALPGGEQALLARQPQPAPWGWPLAVDKQLPAASQPFAFHSRRVLTVAQWPWGQWLALSALLALLLAALRARLQVRAQRRQAQEQARLANLNRLGTLGEMAAGIAHELNQPLTAILANVRAAERLLDDEDERDAVRQALHTSAAQARRAADIVGRLRAMVTQPGGGGSAALDPQPLLESLLLLRHDELASRKIALSWDNTSPSARLQAEPVALEQILHNLVQNAAEALGSRGGRIALRGEVQGTRYRLTVSDNGPGIPPEVLPRLFQPFFTTRQGGMGLGLSLSETLAHGMHGQLTAANLPAGGACFTLSLPLAESNT
ncbi:sensor histidine kinase [Vogesella sp. LIG4]|uniref:sensor histidine kinase n=1 Tax=Vogesella sp. LIG4 TaxID=1192162 RepID=UPI0008201606|nr:ATP-binding protein [Vogesella sp. LIG4]SCK09457.1 His Kinase A (phospho-acceptor) domain-containing protein [Vogesella sp. LIG4]